MERRFRGEDVEEHVVGDMSIEQYSVVSVALQTELSFNDNDSSNLLRSHRHGGKNNFIKGIGARCRLKETEGVYAKIPQSLPNRRLKYDNDGERDVDEHCPENSVGGLQAERLGEFPCKKEKGDALDHLKRSGASDKLIQSINDDRDNDKIDEVDPGELLEVEGANNGHLSAAIDEGKGPDIHATI